MSETAAWIVVIAFVALGVYFAVVDGKRDRAERRSTAAGMSIRYGRGGGHHPRSALWYGIFLLWIAVSAASVAFVLQTVPGDSLWWAPVVAAAIGLLCLVLGIRSLLDFAGTTIVEGTVLERKITRSGEDGEIRNYWIAVDDGSGATTVHGIPISEADHARVVQGAQVRLGLTPRGRQVKWLEIRQLPPSANAATAVPADLLITPVQAAKALRSPVEWVLIEEPVADARTYMYVPPGVEVIRGTAWMPWLKVTEAYSPVAANEIAARLTADSKRKWHHGNTGVFQLGMTYMMTWGDGGLFLSAHVDINETRGISYLAHTLKRPKRAR